MAGPVSITHSNARSRRSFCLSVSFGRGSLKREQT